MARRANKKEKISGRFWQRRFRSQQLLDEASILACAMYGDLNPIRVQAAVTPEASPFTSAYERIQARQRRARRRGRKPGEVIHDEWLSPIELERRERSLTSKSRRRASDRGILPLSQDQYLQLLDWTGRQIRADKRGVISADMAPILERLQISSSRRVDLVIGFGRCFHRSVGRPPSMAAECARRGCRWLQGISHAREAFA